MYIRPSEMIFSMRCLLSRDMKEMKAPWEYLEEKGSEKQKEEVQRL